MRKLGEGNRARNRTLNAGNKVLVLLPNPQHPLRLEWRGPYEVLRKVSNVDYEIEMNGRLKEKGVFIRKL